jgi:hypothetical protein
MTDNNELEEQKSAPSQEGKAARQAILYGIVSSLIFTILLQFLAEKISKATFGGVAVFFQYVIDLSYTQAAVGSTNALALVSASFLLVTVAGLSQSVAIFSLAKALSNGKVKRRLNTDKDSSGISKILFGNKYRYVSATVSGLTTIAAYYLILSFYTSVQAETTFNRQLEIVRPYISDQQEKIFRSRWAGMTKRSEYEDIMRLLESAAKTNNAKIPKRLI